MDIQKLVEQPSESLTVELKNWVDPDTDDGISKLVKAAIAMRNNNGGYVLIGFDNKTCQPIYINVPSNVREIFHKDKIQGMVTKYASETFEVETHFPKIGKNEFPVIEIGSGLKYPVGTKRDHVVHGKFYIKQNRVYVRSLSSNNTPSTTEATWKDWEPLCERCFDNREADIGRFMRRHIGGLNPELLKDFAVSIADGLQPAETLEENLKKFMEYGYERFQKRAKEREVDTEKFGTWEVAAIIDGEIPQYSASDDLLRLIVSSNPNFTGWPSWIVLQSARDAGSEPYVFDKAWESFILSPDLGWDLLDFWRIEPAGRFYLLEALDDDYSGSPKAPEPFKAFDYRTPIIKVAEAIAVSISFAKAMGCDPEKTKLAYLFRWKKLNGRLLCSWQRPGTYFRRANTAYDDEAWSEINIPLDTPNSALAQYVELATKPLFEVFNGYNPDPPVIEELTRKIIERRY
jgi:Schlafen, AlbA_2